MIPLGAVGGDVFRPDRLRFAVAVVRTGPYRVFAGGGITPAVAPLPPRVVARHARQLALEPLPLIDRDLDLRDAAVHRPCKTRDVDHPVGVGRVVFTALGTVDARHRLDRPFLRPATGHPVPVEVLPAGELDLGHPLRRRHVAVQAGYHQPDRVSVLGRQWLAVHRDRQDRVTAVHDHRCRRATIPTVDRSAHDLRRTRCTPASSSRSFIRTPCHRALPTRSPPISVRHARQRDVTFDHRTREQVGEGDLEFVVDHAVDS